IDLLAILHPQSVGEPLIGLALREQRRFGGAQLADRVEMAALERIDRGGRHAAALSSLSAPRITILKVSSASGRCSAFASSHAARNQTSRSSSVVRITGIAFGWIGSTIAFGDVVRNPYTRWGPG